MDEQLLITAVAVHRSLYDPTHKKYKDVELRNAIWQQIAIDLELEVEVCKAKWRTLRDGFTRALRHQRDATKDSPSKVKKPWRYQTEMEFLIPFIYTRESRSNNAEKKTEMEHCDIAQKLSSPSTDCCDGEDDTLSVTSDKTDSPLILPVNLMNISHNSANLKRKAELVDSDDGADFVALRRQEIEALFKGRDLNSPRPAHCQCKCPTDDPTETFFFSMGQSVKRLPFYLQAQVKMKICQLVTDAEMDCLDSATVR